MKKLITVIVLLFLFNGCDLSEKKFPIIVLIFLQSETEITPPVPGNGGLLTITGKTSDTVSISWNGAGDSKTSDDNLEYSVHYSVTNLSTVDEVISNGIQVIPWSPSISTGDISGLYGDVNYNFNVMVRNEDGLMAVYNPVTDIITDKIYLMALGSPGNYYTGDLVTELGNADVRAGIDAECTARKADFAPTLSCTNVRGMISISATDEIRDMPSNYGLPITIPIYTPDGNKIAHYWAKLFTPNYEILSVSIEETKIAGPVGGSFWWSGSNSDGSVNFLNCSNWTSEIPTSHVGVFLTGKLINSTPFKPNCNTDAWLMCACW